MQYMSYITHILTVYYLGCPNENVMDDNMCMDSVDYLQAVVCGANIQRCKLKMVRGIVNNVV